MIFGDPYRFAIWVEYISQWSTPHKNGLFHFVINGNIYPENIKTSTLSVDIYDLIDENCALVAYPENEMIFGLSTQDAFGHLFNLAYPESTEDNEYPEQIFDYCISPSNINNSGAYFFAIANECFVRIIGGKTEQLVKGDDKNYWESIKQPFIEDVTLSKDEVSGILIELKEYANSVLK